MLNNYLAHKNSYSEMNSLFIYNNSISNCNTTCNTHTNSNNKNNSFNNSIYLRSHLAYEIPEERCKRGAGGRKWRR